ncbi:MAG: hypothetical protein QOE22_11 [Candidatus Parcubacteria bacterium]|nr:hypothetical protein [Candidatus Parcubacteria bacterium]
MQVTTTGVAVALAVVVALGMLFLGPTIFSPFAPSDSSSDAALLATTTATTTMDLAAPLPEGELPTELTGTDIVVGIGTAATSGSRVTVNYVGMLPDGTVFDASSRRNEPFTFTLGAGEVIRGWDVGVQGMKEGGKRRLVVPPQDGYGSQGAGDVIPPNATLIFDIELLQVQ